MNRIALGLIAGVFAHGSLAHAQTVEAPFNATYATRSLGSAPGVPANYGGLTVRLSEPNALYLGGAANGSAAQVYSVGLTRDSQGTITGWGCTETQSFCAAPGIDGGLCFGPADVLFYATYPSAQLGQVRPGETTPAKVINLSAIGLVGTTGSVLFVPPGFAGAGQIKFLSYTGSTWQSATVTPDGDGTFDVSTLSAAITIGGGPEGAIYVAAGNPHFEADSVLVSEYGTGRVVAYEIDSNGDPVVSTRRIFITGLSGVEGAMVDPLTGDFLFSTFGGGNQVIAVSGFTQSESCIGDLTGDARVDGADLGQMLSVWGDCPQCPADLNGDCVVSGADLGILLSAWGNCPTG